MAEDKSGGSVSTDSKKVTNMDACLTETDAVTNSSLDPVEEYNMDHKRRGLALIFNHQCFDWRQGLKERVGTQTDRDNLEKRLSDLNFKVETHNDCERSAVLKIINTAASEDHSDADCFLLVFLSHGKKDQIHAKDYEISIEEITSPFKGDNCRSLVGKPKIFILQACRGEDSDDPVTECSAESEPDVMADECALYTLPAGADFIMCYSVAEGYVSFRDRRKGSWYIQDLCKALQMHGTSLEFTDLLTLVNRMVSRRSIGIRENRELAGKKQIPCFASMLTKQLTFKPKK